MTIYIKKEKLPVECPQCHEVFHTAQVRREYCSRGCRDKHTAPQKFCQRCGEPVGRLFKFCSQECRKPKRVAVIRPAKEPKVLLRDIVKTCVICGVEFMGRLSACCSDKCSNRKSDLGKAQKAKDEVQSRRILFVERDQPCAECGKTIHITFEKREKKFCGLKCSVKNHRRRRRRKSRRHCDKTPQQKMRTALSGRLRELLGRRGCKKQETILKNFGCTVQELAAHIEKQFTDGMQWENYGVFGWHVDHIIPCERFDLTRKDHCDACFNWRNLRPLWAEENYMRQHWLSIDDRLNMDPVLYDMAMQLCIDL